MRAAGIDVGSRTVKLVVLGDDGAQLVRLEYNTHDPVEVCRQLLAGVEYDRIVATGYGRHLFGSYWECPKITEIRAVALGSAALVPTTRTVLDIGGQDTKVLRVAENGGVGKFEMNDRCAAGTGRFLEIMAGALAYSMDDFVGAGLEARKAQKVSALCTVFAESEVVSMVARGAPRDELSLGIQEAVASRAVSMLRRVGVEKDVMFCGGVARNACLRGLIEEAIGVPLSVPESPQTVAALGCALAARAPI